MDYIVIGTDHSLQKSDCKDTGLRALLQAILRNCPVRLIAEEVKTSEDVQTFGRQLIGDSNWLSVDMGDQQRKDEGIYDALRSDVGPVRDPATGNDVRANLYRLSAEIKRENFWLDRIEKYCEENGISEGTIVLTCGHNHAQFVGEKLAHRGHRATVKEYFPYDKEQRSGVFQIRP